MMFTGDPVDAATAERIGLVNRVVPADDLMAEATAFAQRLAKSAPIALALAKRALNRAYEMNLEEALDYEAQLQSIAGGQPITRKVWLRSSRSARRTSRVSEQASDH